jgi:CheY-like chemotaxis protein
LNKDFSPPLQISTQYLSASPFNLHNKERNYEEAAMIHQLDIRIPLAYRVENYRAPLMDQPVEELPNDFGATGMPKVLWVDDDLFFLTLAEQTLRLDGFSTLIAQSPSDALALIEYSFPDAVVVDYHMPEMTGEDFAREIKRRWPHLPIFLYSGFLYSPDSHSPFTATFQKGNNCMERLVARLSELKTI